MKNFVLIGAAGYVAPRHMAAIKAVGGNLIAALDPHDSVGILDSYFPDCHFFTEFERFDRHIYKLMASGTKVDYVSIASPNYLHSSHTAFALRIGADAICEKPLVCNEHNLDALKRLEEETGGRVWNILQLRLHPNLPSVDYDVGHLVNVDYCTPRGNWYKFSWKSDVQKSGGLATNIGIHMFDLLSHLFGPLISLRLGCKTDEVVSGAMLLLGARINFRLSISMKDVPRRTLEINGEKIELSSNFGELHTECYKRILDGAGFGIEDTRDAIRICERIRNA